METTSDDVLRHFCRSPRTNQLYERWSQDPSRRSVVPAVTRHSTKTVYELTLADVSDVCHRTEHALGEVRRAEGEAVRQIVDWHPNFAFTHMFHICLERNKQLPTYQEFRAFTQSDELGQLMLGRPSRDKVREVVESGVPEHRARSAMRWRVGNAYYSFLSEIVTVVTLRKSGLNVQVHPLADALFRVDAWVGRKNLSLRVGNKKFRQGEYGGRKQPAEDILADIVPPMAFETIELKPATEFGRVHVPSEEELLAVAARLHDSS